MAARSKIILAYLLFYVHNIVCFSSTCPPNSTCPDNCGLPPVSFKYIYGVGWDLFIATQFIVYSVFLCFLTYKYALLYRENYGNLLKVNLRNAIGVHMYLISIFRILYFVDPKGWEHIYNLVAVLAFSRIPETLNVSAYLLIVLFVRKLQRKNLDNDKKSFIYPLSGLMALLVFLQVLFIALYAGCKLSRTNADISGGIVLLIYIVFIYIIFFYYARSLRQRIKESDTYQYLVLKRISDVLLFAGITGGPIILAYSIFNVVGGEAGAWVFYTMFWLIYTSEAIQTIILYFIVFAGVNKEAFQESTKGLSTSNSLRITTPTTKQSPSNNSFPSFTSNY